MIGLGFLKKKFAEFEFEFECEFEFEFEFEAMALMSVSALVSALVCLGGMWSGWSIVVMRVFATVPYSRVYEYSYYCTYSTYQYSHYYSVIVLVQRAVLHTLS